MSWFKKHKKGLLTAVGIVASIGLSVGIGFAGYSFFKKNGLTSSTSIFSPSKTTVPSNTSPVVSEATKYATAKATETTTKIIDIGPFKRTLPPNWHPSTNKVNTAVENGFPNLLENQTWVGRYKKTIKVKTA